MEANPSDKTFSYSASAAEVQTYLRSSDLVDASDVSVSRRSYFNGGYEWLVTFGRADGNVPISNITGATLTGTSPSATITEVVAGTSDEIQLVALEATGGNFFLEFRGEETEDISYSATAAQVTTALEALSTIGSGGVVVTRQTSGTDDFCSGNYCWYITFNSPLHAGDQPLLYAGGVNSDADIASSYTSEARSPGLTSSASAAINVTEYRKGTLSALSGAITIMLDGDNVTVPHDSSETEMKAAVESLRALVT